VHYVARQPIIIIIIVSKPMVTMATKGHRQTNILSPPRIGDHGNMDTHTDIIQTDRQTNRQTDIPFIFIYID